MANNLYYDLNDGLLCWKDENGNFIPVRTNSALADKNLKIYENKLWIFDYEKNDWKVVGDFEFASQTDLDTKLDKIISVSNINTLIEDYNDPGVYNIAISNSQVSSEAAILLVSSIFNTISFSKILLTTEGISVVLENLWKLYRWNKLDELEKKQNDFDIEIGLIHNELLNNFEVIQEKKFSTVTCDAAGNLTITTSTIDGTNTNTYSINVKGQNGKDGVDGKDGLTPHINTSGTWMIGNQDTGIQAKGKDGINGKDGKDGKDAPIPEFKIENGSIQYKLSDQTDWNSLISNKEIFILPDVQTELPQNPTDGLIITWEGDPNMGIDISFTPGKKYQYLAAGRILKEEKLLGKIPDATSYTVFNLNKDLTDIKKDILTSSNKVITLAGIYCPVSLTSENTINLSSLQNIYNDGSKLVPLIQGSQSVYEFIEANPSITHWAVAEVEEVLLSGKWIQIS